MDDTQAPQRVRAPQAPPHGSPSSRVPFIALLAICIGKIMVSLDATVVNVALPTLRGDLHSGLSGLQWVVDGYTLAFAGLLLSAGAIGDRTSAKKVFQLGLLLFTIASAACGLAANVPQLVLGRVVQGIGAALLTSTSVSLLQAVYPDRAGRARAFGIWGGLGGVAVAAGPVVGGGLVASLGWRSVFFINVPIGVLGLVIAARYVPAPRGTGGRLDLPAQAASIVALSFLTDGFIEIGSHSWADPRVAGAFAVAAVATVVFLALERRSATPMLDLRLFRNRNFSAATFTGFVINFGFYGQLFIISLYLQGVRHYSAFATGLAFLPQAAMAAYAAFVSGRVTAKVGARRPMLAGLTAGAAGLAALAVAGRHTPYLILLLPLVALGFGQGFTSPAAMTAVMTSTPTSQGGVAAGVINSSRQVGSVMGVAVLGSLVGAREAAFVPGLRLAVLLAALGFATALVVTLLRVDEGHTTSPA